MRNLAIVGLVFMELFVAGCGSNSSTTSTAQTAANGIWESSLIGSDAGVGVFNFTTAFTINGDGSLSVTYFSFLTTAPTACFPLTGESTNGSFDINSTGNTASANFQFTVQSGGNSLSLTGTATGTTDASGNTTWTSITGNWTLTGGSGCTGTGTFTMTKTAA